MKKSFLLALAAFAGLTAASAAEYSLPFTLTPSETTFEQCTPLDVNNDAGKNGSGDVIGAWTYYGYSKNAFKYTYTSNQADDWLIMPAVDFGDCKKVKVSFQIETYSGDKEDFAVYLGHENTVAGMTVPVLSETNFSKGTFGELSAEVTVPDDGNTVWYLGFHVTSPGNRGWIYLKDIKIESAETGETVVIPGEPVITNSTVNDLNYTATVQMPSTDTNGNAIAAPMNLLVSVDGTVVETKTDCAAGADVNVALELTAGEHTIGYQAVLGGKAGAMVTHSVEASEHVIVPEAPTAECSVENLTMTATVTMPTKDTDGNDITGTMALEVSVDGTVVTTMTYIQPGDTRNVSRALSAGRHTIGFRAVLNGQKSAEVTKTVVATEPVFQLPYTFNPASDFSQCVHVDANGDGNYGKGEWKLDDNGNMVYTYHPNNQADDWEILPFVDMSATRKVKVTVWVKTGSYPEGFELKLGSPRAVAGMTIPVMKKENYTSTSGQFDELSATVELPAAAAPNLALGVHAISEKDKYTITISKILIEDASIEPAVPAVPVIKTSSTDVLTYTATVTMPEVDTTGKAIEGAMSLEVTVDGEVVETKTECAAGSEVDINLDLVSGEHTIGFTAILNKERSETVTETVTASTIATGELPFTFIATEETFAQCIPVDLDGSVEEYGNVKGTWSFENNSFKYTYNPKTQADDWLILPLVNFGESTRVKVTVDVMTEFEAESFEICLGRERTVEAMTIKVMERTGFKSQNKWTTLSAEVDVPSTVSRSASNSFAPALHATSPANRYLMYFNNLKIESLASTPTGVDDVTVDEAAEAEYYNLQGIRVQNPGPGIYILRQGSKVSKVRL